MDLRDRMVGSLLGLAVCDAVGTTVEFMPPGSFEVVSTMKGGGKFSLQPGQWTDDTSMALCLAESLIECKGFNPVDQLKRYWQWYESGHLSSTGECFDVGKTVSMALHKFQRSKESDPFPGSTATTAAGNGSLMRLCPVPLYYRSNPAVAIAISGESSRTTHGAQAAIDACRYFSGLIVGALSGTTKDELLSSFYCPIASYWEHHPLVPEVSEVAAGSFKSREPPVIVASGYVVRSLEAVLWAFNNTATFEEGCLKVVNLGNDADTVGAIYGQLAGAYYGVSAIPHEWLDKCSLKPLIELFAYELLALGTTATPIEATLPSPTDWKDLYPVLPRDKLSIDYQNIKLMGYDLLEAGNKEIVRKLNPCPKAYKKLEDFDQDVANITAGYNSLPKEAQSVAILKDFSQRWSLAREKLILKLERRRV